MLSLLILQLFLCCLCAGAVAHPNLVYILADDLGYGDVQCQNPDSKIPTPNIDKLAAGGMRFTDLHTNSAVCSPTRYGIMTGRYSFRTWLQKGALSGYQKAMISEGRITVASLLKDNGYYTTCIGKWHMGWNWGRDEKGKVDFTKPFTGGPIDSGFDSFFGIPASLDIPPYCYCEDDRVLKLPTRQVPKGVFGGRPGVADPDLKPEQMMLDINDRITTLIKNHKILADDRPFFVYYPLPAPHVPVVPAKQFIGKTTMGKYGDYVFEVDWVVGEVVKALEEAGIADNTIVMFTADNGASPSAAGSAIRKGHRPNWPYRGGKTTLWDGGHRVPFIVRWPAKVRPGSVNNELFCTTDLLATCSDIVGQALPDNAGEDSISMLPALQGKPTPQTRKGVIHHSVYGNFAIRSGKWKYIAIQGGGGWGYSWGMKRIPIDKDVPGQLYNMDEDVFEEHNLYSGNPEIVKTMAELLETLVQDGRSTPGAKQENDVLVNVK
jgi:arylsulfatase A-like enzyme